MAPKPEPERREVKVYGPDWRTAEHVEMVPAADYDRVVEERDLWERRALRVHEDFEGEAIRAEAAEREVERLKAELKALKGKGE